MFLDLKDWILNLERSQKKKLRKLIKKNKKLIHLLKNSKDRERILKIYWKIRKNSSFIARRYYFLMKYVSKDYEDKYIKYLSLEIYYYEKLLQDWRCYFPENNIRYDYYLEIAKLEYNFFIKSKYKMLKELRKEIYQYNYKEKELERQNLFIIFNNLKHSQKILERDIVYGYIHQDYEELFLSYEILGNILISIYGLFSSNEDDSSIKLNDLISQSLFYFLLALENKKINDDPEIYREGIVNLPYIDQFFKFFREKGFNKYYNLEAKIDFLHKYYASSIYGTIIERKLENIKEKEITLENRRVRNNAYYEALKKEDIKISKKEKKLEGKKHKIQEKVEENIANQIFNQLTRKDDESNKIEFKESIGDKLEIAKTICGFCNRFILTNEEGIIVFGIRDKKNMEEGYKIVDRILPLTQLLSNSGVKSVEDFMIKINHIVDKHLRPNADPCYKIYCVNLKNNFQIENDLEVLVIYIDKFAFDAPIKAYYKDKYYIRRNSETLEVKNEDLIQLMKKLSNRL